MFVDHWFRSPGAVADLWPGLQAAAAHGLWQRGPEARCAAGALGSTGQPRAQGPGGPGEDLQVVTQVGWYLMVHSFDQVIKCY